jgi:glycosyltransferase involved in cell wall biosynthesis
MTTNSKGQPPRISIAVRAWNEEAVIRRTLESLFGQSLFEELSARGEWCEVLCIPNGCTDRTAEIAAQFSRNRRTYIRSATFRRRAGYPPGRITTWNALFISASEAGSFSPGLGHVFNRRESVQHVSTLLENPARIASDQPIKNVPLKPQIHAIASRWLPPK